MQNYYDEETGAVLRSLDTTTEGLSALEAERRLSTNGKNKLEEAKGKSLIRRFFEQMTDPMIIILIVAAAVSAVLAVVEGEGFTDVIIILAVVIVNAILGVYQENKAEKAIEALQEMSAATSKVLRDGQMVTVHSEDLVVGDIVLLEAGDAVPADGRLIDAASLKVEEAALTGESVPVEKETAALPHKDGAVPLGDRKNMAYTGSTVVYGRGMLAVTATGMDTELGKIAGALAKAEDGQTPLQIKLSQLSKILTFLVLGICVVVFIAQMIRAGGFTLDATMNSLMIAVSLAVAAIPEGLAAVVTVVLSIGVTNMSKRNAIIRKLTAVETLGCAQIICSDKTGTLTQNKMTVVEHFGDDEKETATGMALCSDAELLADGSVNGEPTEAALVAYAHTLGIEKPALKEEHPRFGEAPFDSNRKLMSTVHPFGESFVQYTKGAPDVLIARCDEILKNGKCVPITAKDRTELLTKNKQMADQTLRVLALGKRFYREMPADTSPEALEEHLVFVGLVGMKDPIRPEVAAAMVECRNAGIRPIMITGDHVDTAAAIGRELGILDNELPPISFEEVERFRNDPEAAVRALTDAGLTGKKNVGTSGRANDGAALNASVRTGAAAANSEKAVGNSDGRTLDSSTTKAPVGPIRAISGAVLDAMDDATFEKWFPHIGVYARVQPEHKTRIVNAWRKAGYVTAMTGDGVNDAPSIKAADIGVGMGITGTDVTKNVADMVLADDNFATIVGAVEEGRRIYDNIRKAIQFLLGSNLSEVLAIFVSSLLGFTILKPVHLLWINLLTDTFPALALGTEKAEPDIMQRKPRDSKEGIFSGGMGGDILYQGILVAALVFVSYLVGVYFETGAVSFKTSAHGMTMAFLTMSFAEIFHSFNMRSQKMSIFQIKGINKSLIFSAIGAVLATTLVAEVPFLANAFGFVSVGLREFLIAGALGLCVIPVVELVKCFKRMAKK